MGMMSGKGWAVAAPQEAVVITAARAVVTSARRVLIRPRYVGIVDPCMVGSAATAADWQAVAKVRAPAA
ncbi:hypothetical protein IDVR_18610 [Intrasporangium sp. DVR]